MPRIAAPRACASAINPATASRFRVMFKDNKWVIPSHYDYPADARDRLSKTAAAVMDLTKDTIRSDSGDDQEAMGVIDPLDAKVSALKGRGKRITLRDASGKALFLLAVAEPAKADAASTPAPAASIAPGDAAPSISLLAASDPQPDDEVERIRRAMFA